MSQVCYYHEVPEWVSFKDYFERREGFSPTIGDSRVEELYNYYCVGSFDAAARVEPTDIIKEMWMPYNREEKRWDLSDEPYNSPPNRELTKGWCFRKCLLIDAANASLPATPTPQGQTSEETVVVLMLAKAAVKKFSPGKDCPWMAFAPRAGTFEYATQCYRWFEIVFGSGQFCICDDGDWWYVEERKQ